MSATFVLFLISIVEVKPQQQLDVPNSIMKSNLERESTNLEHIYRTRLKNNRNQEDFPELDASKIKKEYIREPPNDALTFLSPRDQIQFESNMLKNRHLEEGNRKALPKPMWLDFSKMLERNIANPYAGRRSSSNSRSSTTKGYIKINNTYNNKYFNKHTFYRTSNVKHQVNWTTCDEFVKKSVFHPDDVINTKWLPFYTWSQRGFRTAVIHTFSYPTKKTVQRFKSTYGPYIQKVDWYGPKLLLKERRQLLLIAGDRRGLFYGIPEHDLGPHIKGQNISLPVKTLRLKIYEPYLVMMYCDDYYATVMAELNTGPQSEGEKAREAGVLNFRGVGGPVCLDEDELKRNNDLVQRRKKERESEKILQVQYNIG